MILLPRMRDRAIIFDRISEGEIFIMPSAKRKKEKKEGKKEKRSNKESVQGYKDIRDAKNGEIVGVSRAPYKRHAFVAIKISRRRNCLSIDAHETSISR